MTYINDISTANPRHKYNQLSILKSVYKFHPEIEPKKIDILFQRSAIDHKYSVIDDIDSDDCAVATMPITQRMDIYKAKAVPLAIEAVTKLENSTDETTHIITVSCTGLAAPHIDIDIIKELQLPASTQRLSVNFMGCYAAFQAIKMAHHICRSSPDAKVLVVCVELCSLHIQKGNRIDDVLSNTLFSDGAAAMIISNDKKGLLIKDIFQDIIPSSKDDMAWDVGAENFTMKLSSEVPSKIGAYIHTLLDYIRLHRVVYHAVHPGGRKILDQYQSIAAIADWQIADSYSVLKNHGNMSSATILFVLKQMLYGDHHHGPILATGFGPGLTVEGLLLEK